MHHLFAYHENKLFCLFTVDVLAKRFKNIRDTFRDNLKRVNEFKKKCSGAGAGDSFQPTWHLWSSVQFLRKTFAVAPGDSNLDIRRLQAQHQSMSSPSSSSSSPSCSQYSSEEALFPALDCSGIVLPDQVSFSCLKVAFVVVVNVSLCGLQGVQFMT